MTTAHAAEYDHIGDRYSEAKTAPFRLHLEAHTLEKLAGDVRGARVLDLACGDGFYGRRLMRRGAAASVGIDASIEMVALGRRAEAAEPLGCRYVHADVKQIGRFGEFDVVVAAYLLNYASSRDELRRLCAAVARNLRSGGRVVGVNDYTVDGVSGSRDFAAHRFRKVGPDPYREGSEITYEFLLPEGRSFAITNYFWQPETYAEELRAAGLRDVAWHRLEPSEEGVHAFPRGYFADLLEAAPLAAFVAYKP